jgi:hypothetical protein
MLLRRGPGRCGVATNEAWDYPVWPFGPSRCLQRCLQAGLGGVTMTVPLDGGDEPVTIGERVRLRAPGLVGTVEVLSPSDAVAAVDASDATGAVDSMDGEGGASHLRWALGNASLIPRARFVVVPTSAPDADSTVEVTPSAPDRQAVLLSQDPAGVLRWHLPESHPARALGPGVAATSPPDLAIRLPREPFQPQAASPAADADPDLNATSAETATAPGPPAEAATLLTLLEFPISLGGQVAADTYAEWERIARPSVATWFPPKHGLQQQAVPLDDATWRTLAEDRTLLFLHGIFGTCAGAFGGLLDTTRPDTADLWARLDIAYGGRIIAFDHPTASVRPEDNAEAFLALIPPDVHLELDIVCHSRGGLVARILDGQLPPTTGGSLLDLLLSPLRQFFPGNRPHGTVTVRKIVFVGTPNGGTEIVEDENWNTFVDSFTTLLGALPPGPWSATTPFFEGILELVKDLAAGTAENLPGLRAMDPDSSLYAGLGQYAGNAPLYYAVEANYEPAPGDLLGEGVNDLIDPVFHRQPNDVAVPSAGVGDPATVRPTGPRPTTITGFPIPADRRLVFDPAQVWHLTYFQQEQTRTHLRRWLA